ncbi:MAG: ATP-grasp domain-containing protein [Myxococcales bacterium]|nr:ATP-grasp domain-containing protein [Myxococcales bacterium]MBL0196999.1 ATP-grasp domain-containing protein [Myxococcales bacterium]HQY63959.1 ATP-grasp domain-containing protein [Polyangiaceae bacterium]
MRVVFLSPAYPAEMCHFTRGLAEVGTTVYGVGDTPREALPSAVRPYLADYLTVPRITDEADVSDRVSAWLRGRTIDHVLTNWEPLVLLAARLRERWGIPGMSVDVVRGFRDKEIMKVRLRAAGLRVPRSWRVRTADEAREAAERVGYPLILKPIAGAGCADTYRVESRAELERVLPTMSNVAEASCEEYIEGEEFTYDTVSLRGRPVVESMTAYIPKPLEARTHEWISPIGISIRDLAQPRLAPGLELGRAALAALGMGSGFTHMEWYLTPSGEAVFGEIACRSGGAGIVDQMNYTCDTDLFREWARVSCWGHFEGETTRKYNVGMVFKRAIGRGLVTRIEGLGAWLHACGPCVVEDSLLRPGTPRRDWQQTTLADGRLMVRHPDFGETLRMCQAAATDVRIYAQ